MTANHLTIMPTVLEPIEAKKVLITGLNVAVQQRSSSWFGSAPHWKILEIFYQNLPNCRFGAIQVFNKTGRSGYDYALEAGLDILLLNGSPYLGLSRIKETPRVYGRLMRAVAESDYVYVRLPSWAGLAAWRCARWLGKPYWVSVHGDWSQILQTYVNSSKSAFRRFYYRFSRKLAERAQAEALAYARCVFFVGQALCEKLQLGTVPSVIYQDVTHLATDVWELRQNQPGPHVTLLFVGEISKAKGVAVLLEAAAHLASRGHRPKLVLVGQGPEVETLRAQTIPGVDLDIKGWVPHGETFDRLFQLADALVLPSFTEGVPRVVVEAMVRATPVIATRVGGTSELLGGGTRGWLVEAGDSLGLANAVEVLLRDGHERASKIRQSIEYAKAYDKAYWTNIVHAQLRQIDPDLVGPTMGETDDSD